MDYVTWFFVGAFACNGIPHVVCGLQGTAFPTPFAKPRGVGDSSPLVNFYWGLVNLLAAGALAAFAPFDFGVNAATGLFVLGAAALGSYLARHFGIVRAARRERG